MRREVPPAAPFAPIDREAPLPARLAPRARLLGVFPRRIAVFLLTRFVAQLRLVLLLAPPNTLVLTRENIVEPAKPVFELRLELRDFPRPRRPFSASHAPRLPRNLLPRTMV